MGFNDLLKKEDKISNGKKNSAISDEKRELYLKRGWIRKTGIDDTGASHWSDWILLAPLLAFVIYVLFQIPLIQYVKFFFIVVFLILWFIWFVKQINGGSGSNFMADE